MKIVMINVPREQARRDFQMRQAARLGLNLEFVDAVCVEDLTDETLQDAANQWTRKVRAQDIACTFSHKRVWELVAAQQDKVCVLEDDVLLSEKFKAVLEQIDAREDCWSCIYDLEYAHYKHTVGRRVVWKDSDLNIACRRIYKNKRGAAAYIIGPRTAKRLLKEATGYKMMEAFLWTRNWSQPVQIEPCPAVQLDVLDPNAKFGVQKQKPLVRQPHKAYQNQSWLKAKLVRLSVSLNELTLVSLGLVFGQRRNLEMNPAEFRLPEAAK